MFLVKRNRSFAHFVGTIAKPYNRCAGILGKVHATVMAEDSELEKHACQNVIDNVMKELRGNSRFKDVLQDRKINFKFTGMPENLQPTDEDSPSLGAALVAAVINLLMSPENNCNWFVATGIVEAKGEIKGVGGIMYKGIEVFRHIPDLAFVVPKENYPELEEDRDDWSGTFKFIGSIDELLDVALKKDHWNNK